MFQTKFTCNPNSSTYVSVELPHASVVEIQLDGGSCNFPEDDVQLEKDRDNDAEPTDITTDSGTPVVLIETVAKAPVPVSCVNVATPPTVV